MILFSPAFLVASMDAMDENAEATLMTATNDDHRKTTSNWPMIREAVKTAFERDKQAAR